MTKDELKNLLDALGVKLEDLKGEAADKVQAWIDERKFELDTETRRKVRAVWIVFSTLALVVGLAGGWYGHILLG